MIDPPSQFLRVLIINLIVPLVLIYKFIFCSIVFGFHVCQTVKYFFYCMYLLIKQLVIGNVPAAVFNIDLKVNDKIDVRSRVVTYLSLFNPKDVMNYEDAKTELINLVRQVVEKSNEKNIKSE